VNGYALIENLGPARNKKVGNDFEDKEFEQISETECLKHESYIYQPNDQKEVYGCNRWYREYNYGQFFRFLKKS